MISYLLNRKQFIVVGGEKFPALPVLSGVPQGSVLGPLFFLIYRIAGKFGGELNLVVWRSILQPPN